MSDDWDVVEKALIGYICPADEPNPWEAIARLREREASLKMALDRNISLVDKAEARVAQLEEALRRAAHELDQWVFADGTASYRVERAEEIIAAALAHEEAMEPVDG